MTFEHADRGVDYKRSKAAKTAATRGMESPWKADEADETLELVAAATAFVPDGGVTDVDEVDDDLEAVRLTDATDSDETLATLADEDDATARAAVKTAEEGDCVQDEEAGMAAV